VSATVIRQSFVPMLAFYIIIMVVLAVGLRMSRRPAASQRARRPMHLTDQLVHSRPGWPRLITHYATTVVGGYLLLMAVVLIYYFGVARVGGNFIESGVTGFALLIGLSTPVFAVITWLTTRKS
jgi:hypothetical protein